MGNAYDDEVRRRVADAFRSAGIDEGRVAVEVLYWLPSEFMDDYREVFTRALSLGDSEGGTGGGKRDENVVKKIKAERGTRGSMRALGGRRVYQGEWIVKDEDALELKMRVDRRLKKLVRGVARQMGMEQAGAHKLVERSHGEGPGALEVMGGKGDKKRCRDCGKIAKGDWVRCPYQHATD